MVAVGAAEIWLGGDHYKWRALRTNGVNERFVTGDATPREKFQAWAETVPHTLRNPLYHWSHLELKRYFGFDGLLVPDHVPVFAIDQAPPLPSGSVYRTPFPPAGVAFSAACMRGSICAHTSALTHSPIWRPMMYCGSMP